MTAVIGFHTKDGIVVATDSQVTRGDTKQCDSTKLIQVRFKNGVSALVARAGSIDGANIFHEIFETMASATEVTSWRTIADTAEAALKQAKAKILDGANHPGLPSNYGKEHLESLFHRLLLAYVFDGKPFLFDGESSGASVIKNIHPFTATGTGQNTASFILEGMNTLAMDKYEGIGLAAYTIEMCKRADLYCAGAIQIGRVASDGAVTILDRDMVEMMQTAVNRTHRAVCTNLAREISSNFNKLYMPYLDAEEQKLNQRLAMLAVEKAKILSARPPTKRKPAK